ncbi:MAG: cupin domain-containing protein [Telluria sp.]
MSESRQIVRQGAAQTQCHAEVIHPLNPQARRRTTSLGDATGLTRVGVHINVIAPGGMSTEPHTHAGVDEFIYVLSGEARVTLGGNSHDVGAGDFIGFPANGPAHAMTNTGSDDLVYLVGGNRAAIDVCDYPQKGKRLYVFNGPGGRQYDLVDMGDVQSLTR